MTEPQEPRGATPAHLTSEELSECAFSPETAPAGLLGHAEGCARCSAELADLRLVLTELAALPEPELPEAVAIRLDAAVARAWLDVDAEQEERADVAAPGARRGRRWTMRKLAVPLAAFSLIAIAAVGIGVALHSAGESASSSGVSAASNAQSSYAFTSENPVVAAWVRSVLPNGSGRAESPMAVGVHCTTKPPQRTGYTVLTTSQRAFENEPATLVVYQNAQEPASPTVYAVVYAGSCPSSASAVLAQGSVSR